MARLAAARATVTPSVLPPVLRARDALSTVAETSPSLPSTVTVMPPFASLSTPAYTAWPLMLPDRVDPVPVPVLQAATASAIPATATTDRNLLIIILLRYVYGKNMSPYH
jgi:hypothetical protein